MIEVKEVGKPGFYLAWKPGTLLTLVGSTSFYDVATFLSKKVYELNPNTIKRMLEQLDFRLFYFDSMSEYGLALHCFSKSGCMFWDPHNDDLVNKHMDVVNQVLNLRVAK